MTIFVEKQIDMEILKYVASLITGYFLYYLKQLNTPQTKYNNSLEAVKVLSEIKSNRNEFIVTNFEENHFFLQTGIKTNLKNIEKFIAFYNETELPWSTISRAQKHLDISEDKIQIQLKSYWFKIKDGVLIFALSIIMISGLFFPLFDNIVFKTFKSTLFFVIIFMVLSFISYLLVSSIDSIIAVDIIKKKLIEIESSNLRKNEK